MEAIDDSMGLISPMEGAAKTRAILRFTKVDGMATIIFDKIILRVC